MAAHLARETDVPELQSKLAEYYGNSLKPEPGETSGIPRRNMDPKLAELLGVDPNKALTAEQVAHLMTGSRADGKDIPGQKRQRATELKSSVAYIDFCLSAPKSFSVALAFAPTDAERAILDRCHREATAMLMAHIEAQIGYLRKGKEGTGGTEKASIAWFAFDHYTARPTVKIAVQGGTVIQTVRVCGDMQRHTHFIVPTVALDEHGGVGKLHLNSIKGSIHEWGAIYQAFLATKLNENGIEAVYDKDTGMARLPAVPRWICDAFSKRTKDGKAAAKAYAERKGLDWNALTGKQRVELLKAGAQETRQGKGDDMSDYAEWQRQAKEAGYRHRSVIRPGMEQELGPFEERMAKAFEAFHEILDPELQRIAVFDASVARIAAAKSLIASGSLDAKEVNVLTAAARAHGVQQEGQKTAIAWGTMKGSGLVKFTTEMHVAQEAEAIRLLRESAADKSTNINMWELHKAIAEVEAEDGFKFTPEQVSFIEDIAQAGRSCAAIGGAGVGKSSTLKPLAKVWHNQGKRTIGLTVAWRQTHGLADAGIGKRPRRKSLVPDTSRLKESGVEAESNYALTAFLRAAAKGWVKVDANTVVIVDEVGLEGTVQVRELARLQKEFGFQLVQVGDWRQCQSIAAGNTVRLLQKAYGEKQVPILINSIRQVTDRDKETARLFRDGEKGAVRKALERMAEDNALHIVPGDREEAIQKGVDVWQRWMEENKGRLGFSAAITVPTNNDAREVGAEVRKRLKAAGEVGKDDTVIKACDQIEAHQPFDLPIAVGDSVRLFNTVYVDRGDKRPRFGENGSVMKVLDIRPDGLELRNARGLTGFVTFDQIRDPARGVPRLTYGYAVTIDSRQSETHSHHLTIAPEGTRAINGFKAYTTFSRHRYESVLVTSQGAEIEEIEARRPLGDPRNKIKAKVHEFIIENMSRNLARQPEKQLATEMLEKAEKMRWGAVKTMQAAWFRQERRERRGKSGTIQPVRVREKEEEAAINIVAEAIKEQTESVSHAVSSIAPKAERPRAPVMSEVDLTNDFAAALSRAGLIVDGAPIMDGKKHYVDVVGAKKGTKKGIYSGRTDFPPNGWFKNYREGGELQKWKPNVQAPERSPEELAAWRAQQELRRIERERKQKAEWDTAAAIATQIWRETPEATSHPYLAAKKIEPHGMHVRGKYLLVPLQNAAGAIRNLQWIRDDGKKMFGVPGEAGWIGGQKSGLYTVLGALEPGKPRVIGEGFATMATLYESTALTSIIALDGNNLMPVAETIRALDKDARIIFAADNDHTLPLREDLPQAARKNVGLLKAHEAARKVKGVVVAPKFEGESDKDRTDWNDFRLKHGEDYTNRLLKQTLTEMSVPVQGPLRRRDIGRGR